MQRLESIYIQDNLYNLIILSVFTYQSDKP